VSSKARPNLGQISSDLSFKDPGDVVVAEQGKEQLKDYLPKLIETTEHGKKKYVLQDFYIVVLTKRERLMSNVFRHYFFTRMSCPTPDWDQAVYRYSAKKDEVEFLWVIPDPITIKYFTEHVFDIPEEDKCLLKFIIDFNDGTLDKLARQLNGEKEKQVNPIVRVES
jgi:hypothetical protein